MSNENTERNNAYSYTRCHFYHSSTSTDDQGQRTTKTWRGGYGQDNKDGQTRYFVLPADRDDAKYVEVNEDEYKRTKTQVQDYIDAKPMIENIQPSHVSRTPQDRIEHIPKPGPLQLKRRLDLAPARSFYFGENMFEPFFNDAFGGLFDSDEIRRLREENRALKEQLRRRN